MQVVSYWTISNMAYERFDHKKKRQNNNKGPESYIKPKRLSFILPLSVSLFPVCTVLNINSTYLLEMNETVSFNFTTRPT